MGAGGIDKRRQSLMHKRRETLFKIEIEEDLCKMEMYMMWMYESIGSGGAMRARQFSISGCTDNHKIWVNFKWELWSKTREPNSKSTSR